MNARRRRGFTFVEILAALAFLGILIPVVVSALMVSNRSAVMAERSTVAAQLGENQLGEMLLADAWTNASNRGDFGADYPGYRWEMQQADWDSGAMTELVLDVFYTVQGREQSIRLSTLVNESLTQAALHSTQSSTPSATP
jgi:prepilin-type N-terminal cleavage/methylation domain-containing protein